VAAGIWLAVIFKVAASRVGPVQMDASEAAGVARLQNSGTDAVPVHAGRKRERKVAMVTADKGLASVNACQTTANPTGMLVEVRLRWRHRAVGSR